MDNDYVVVIGGANIDICGKPDAPLIPRDSNFGRNTFTVGGVGLNIAHNLKLMGVNVYLITAFGNDEHGRWIQERCANVGIDVGESIIVDNESTSTSVFIDDKDGNLNVAVTDMNIYREITPEFLEGKLSLINKARVLIVDTSISTESIAFLGKKVRVPIFADPISCTKAARLLPSLSTLFAIMPNSNEARILTGIKPDSDEELEKSVKVFLDSGVKNVFITLGDEGVYSADRKTSEHVRGLPNKVVNSYGSDEAMIAGFVYAYINELSQHDAALIGLSAYSINVECYESVNESLNIETVFTRAGLSV